MKINKIINLILELFFFITSQAIIEPMSIAAIKPQEVTVKSSLAITPSHMDNAVLRRLINEINFEKKESQVNAYNRTHNRHNRGR